MSIRLPIDTERLRIRAFAPDDVDDMLDVYGDEEVMHYVASPVLDRDGTARLLEEYRRRGGDYGYSCWALVQRTTGSVIGDVGFNRHAGEPDLGYTLARRAWGNGYATEAARAALDALFAGTDAPRAYARVDVDNAASRRVLLKLGMRLVGNVEEHGRPHELYVVERS